jgi:hypothetical protein
MTGLQGRQNAAAIDEIKAKKSCRDEPDLKNSTDQCEFTLTRGTRRRSQWTTSVLGLDGGSLFELVAS